MGILAESKLEAEKNKVEYNPTPEERAELDFIFERWEKMKTKRAEYEIHWKKDEDQYLMLGPQRSESEGWMANLKLPDTSAAVLAAQAESVDQTPNITFIPRNPSDQKRADKFNAAWKYSWEKGNGQLELSDFMLQRAIFGTAVGKEYWCQERKNQKEVSEWETDENGNPTYVPKKWKSRNVVTFDDTKFKSIYIKNFWVDEASTTMDNAIDCVELDMQDEKAFHDNYDDLYKNAKLITGQGSYEFDWYSLEETEGKVEVLFYYNKIRDMFSIIANGILLTPIDNPNPYRHKELPYVSSVYIPIIKSFYGMGLPRFLRYLQEEKNTVRNMRLDLSKINIKNIILVDDKLELSDEELVIKPNMIIKGPPGSIEIIKGPETNQSSYREEELLKEDMIRASGIDPRLQTEGGKGDTATEISILKESSMKRIRYTLRLLEWQCLYRLGRLRLANFMQFYKMPKYDSIIDEETNEIKQEAVYPTIGIEKGGSKEFFQFKPEDIKGEYDIIVAPGSTLPISKALESQKRINLFDRLKGHPDVNQRKLAEELIRAHDMPVGDLMTQEGEPPMGASPTRGPEGVNPMPGGGQGMAEAKITPQNVLPAQNMGGVNTNQ
jgi:hypothetical protein